MAQGNPTLPYKLLGRPISSDTPVLVFVPGFPDRCESFEILASHFASTHSLILACLPDYDQRSKSIGGGKLKQRFGYSFPEMSEMLRALIEKEVTRNNGSGPKAVTLISHDWGAFLTYQFTKSYPEMVEAIVSLDVGMGACAVDPFDVTNLLVIFAYQSYLILCFIVSQLLPFGSFFGDIMLGLYPWKWIGPTPHEYKVPRPLNEIKSWMAYPYFQLVKEKLCTLGASPGVANPMHFGKPLLYLYGPRKRAFFHTKAFLKDIDELASSAADQPGAVIAASQWHAISGCGHWMHTQAPDIVAKHISTFFLAIKDMQGPGSSRLKRT